VLEKINGTEHISHYTYDSDHRLIAFTADGTEVAYTYDAFGRLTAQTTQSGEDTLLTESYTFKGNGQNTSVQIATNRLQANSLDVTYSYTYDDNGNILSISDGTNTTSYVYDSANQLIRENNQAGGFTHVWEYNNGGNILYREEYAYTTGSVENLTPTDTVTYTYGDSLGWGDLLTSYDGQTITYDTIGNPLSDGTWTYAWQHGRQLASMSNGTTTWNYTYNSESGIRTQRTNGTTTYNYIYNGSSLTQMTVGNDTLYFTYDANGTPLTVTLNGEPYYYVTNIQGDVIALLNSAGNTAVSYTYDAWGNVLSVSGYEVDEIGTLNPLRYRSYVYDVETQLYYLQSRYYNPEIGRWINADSLVSGIGGDMRGYNLFTYCFNNPVNMFDSTGHWPQWIKDAAAWVNENIIQPVVEFTCDVAEDIKNYDPNNQSEEKVFESNYFSNYKGALVIKTSFKSSFSFGIIGLSRNDLDSDSLKHEYGHYLQYKDLGVLLYAKNVAVPSVTINILDGQDKLPYDYYSYPWEAEANRLGGSALSEKGVPKLPEGGYRTYWDIFKLFFD